MVLSSLNIPSRDHFQNKIGHLLNCGQGINTFFQVLVGINFLVSSNFYSDEFFVLKGIGIIYYRVMAHFLLDNFFGDQRAFFHVFSLFSIEFDQHKKNRVAGYVLMCHL